MADKTLLGLLQDAHYTEMKERIRMERKACMRELGLDMLGAGYCGESHKDRNRYTQNESMHQVGRLLMVRLRVVIVAAIAGRVMAMGRIIPEPTHCR